MEILDCFTRPERLPLILFGTSSSLQKNTHIKNKKIQFIFKNLFQRKRSLWKTASAQDKFQYLSRSRNNNGLIENENTRLVGDPIFNI